MKLGTYAARNLLDGDVLADQRIVRECIGEGDNVTVVYRNGESDTMQKDRPINVIRHEN